MSVDPAVIGSALPPISMTIEAGRLKFFAKAIGETNPVFFDEQAARNAGYPALPVPPTFLFAVELEHPDPMAWLSGIGVDLRHILHGEQTFTYYQWAHAGDTLTAQARIGDVYTKKGGALEFIVKESTLTGADGARVADLNSVIVVRHPEVTK
jgi:acyl dehydratase